MSSPVDLLTEIQKRNKQKTWDSLIFRLTWTVMGKKCIRDIMAESGCSDKEIEKALAKLR